MSMPDRIPLPLTIDYEDVLHFLGYPEGRGPTDRVDARTRQLIAEARELADARGSYRLFAPEQAEELGLATMPAERLVIALVTAGEGIERRATELMTAGDSVAALLMDAAGSAAAEEAADRLGAIIAGCREDGDCEEQAGGRPSALPCRVSPGYGQWALSAQTRLFERLPHRELGVRLLPSLLMTPRKSISFAMWLGSDARPITGPSGCANCRLASCRYRREPGPGGLRR